MLPFELGLARKYLIPNRKSLSVSLIALMSVGVISLVVWLLLLFFSVTDGMEKNWLGKLTTLNAPIRITPTAEYYNSYFYNVDVVASASNYSHKTIGEKLEAELSDPYSPDEDWAEGRMTEADRDDNGELKDPVKGAFAALSTLKEKHSDMAYQDYELSGALMRLELIRERGSSVVTQATYLASVADENPNLSDLLLEGPLEEGKVRLPGDGVLLAKNFYDSGVRVGDRGSFSFGAQTASSVQEQKLKFHVAGFYDPGIMAVGNRCVLVPKAMVRAVSGASHFSPVDAASANGISVWFKNLDETDAIRSEIREAFAHAGIDRYWQVTTFREYDFAKDLMQQFQSDRVLFSLIGIIILIVGCSNIISMLVLLVNDKKKEIGILQAMGASRLSIAAIFGTCGALMGVISAVVGTLAALLTLHNIDAVVRFLSFVQGHEAFNTIFYGSSLPNELSGAAMRFILIVTPVIALLAGLVPAVKACRMTPSEILRSE